MMIEVARLVFEPLAFGNVAHQRFDPDRIAFCLCVRRDFDPHRRPIGAPQTKEVIGQRAIASEPRDERSPRLRIDEPLGIEWTHFGHRGFPRVAEHEFEMRIGREGLGRVFAEQTDVNPLVDRLEEARKSVPALIVGGHLRLVALPVARNGRSILPATNGRLAAGPGRRSGGRKA